jgi:hypothetical protein
VWKSRWYFECWSNAELSFAKRAGIFIAPQFVAADIIIEDNYIRSWLAREMQYPYNRIAKYPNIQTSRPKIPRSRGYTTLSFPSCSFFSFLFPADFFAFLKKKKKKKKKKIR